jgi:hypothetical protein
METVNSEGVTARSYLDFIHLPYVLQPQRFWFFPTLLGPVDRGSLYRWSTDVVSHLDNLKYASFKVLGLEKEIRVQEWKNHHINSHTSYSVMVCYLNNNLHLYFV